MSRDYRKLEVFVLADDLALEVYRVTAQFPKHEVYGLTSQLRRAAVSVPTNIVEGSHRDTAAEYLRFLDIALGSLAETGYLLSLSTRLGYLNPGDTDGITPKQEQCIRMLKGLIKALRGEPKAQSPKPKAQSHIE